MSDRSTLIVSDVALTFETEKAMEVNLILVFYGGPDQLMPITSGLTAIFAFLLIFWNKMLRIVGKLLRIFRDQKPASSETHNDGRQGDNTAHDTINQSHL